MIAIKKEETTMPKFLNKLFFVLLSVVTISVFSQEIKNLENTTWRGIDNEKNYQITFLPNGSLQYMNFNGVQVMTYSKGSWVKNGNQVFIELNDRYVEKNGEIFGKTMKGSAKNKVNKTWSWEYQLIDVSKAQAFELIANKALSTTTTNDKQLTQAAGKDEVVATDTRTVQNCSSQADYELGLKNGLKMAPPCKAQNKDQQPTSIQNKPDLSLVNELKKIGWVESKTYSCLLWRAEQGSINNLKPVQVDRTNASTKVNVKLNNGTIVATWQDGYIPPSGTNPSLSGHKFQKVTEDGIAFNKKAGFDSQLWISKPKDLIILNEFSGTDKFMMAYQYACS
jgi:hypothetical protein